MARALSDTGWKSRFARGAGAGFVIQGMGAGLALGVSLILARSMGTVGYGSYSFLLNIARAVAVLGCLGLDATSMRFIPEYQMAQRPPAMNGFIWSSLAAVLFVSIVLGLVLIPILSWPGAWRGEFSGTERLLCGALVPLLSIGFLLQGHLRGLKRTTAALVPDQILRPLGIGAGVFAFWLELRELVRPVTGLAVTVASLLVSVAVMLVSLGKSLPRGEAGPAGKREYEIRQWAGVAVVLLGIDAVSALLGRADVFVLGSISGMEKVGLYAVALRISALVSFGLAAMNVIGAPMISELYRSEQAGDLRALVSRMVRIGSVFGLVSGAALVLLSPWIFRALGPGFAGAKVPLEILIAGQVINVAVGPVGYLLTMTHGHKAAFGALAQAAVLNVGCAIAGAMWYGAAGVAAATAIATAWWNLAMLYRARGAFGWWIVPFLGVVKG